MAHIRRLRGQAVILDSDLAWFLGIAPEQIVEVVRRRTELFPFDFVFHLTAAELEHIEHAAPCLTLTGKIHPTLRLAFTTHGVGLLLLAFKDDGFALAAIPVLRAIQKFWRAGRIVLLGERS